MKKNNEQRLKKKKDTMMVLLLCELSGNGLVSSQNVEHQQRQNYSHQVIERTQCNI